MVGIEWWVVAIVVVAVAVGVRSLFERPVVYEYEHALRYRDGRLHGPLGPGRHWIRRGRDLVVRADARPQLRSVPGQEVLSADGIPLKVSLTVRYEIADPVVALHQHQLAVDDLYVALQLALRAAVSTREIEDLIADRNAIAPELRAAAEAAAPELGLTVLDVDVKDLMLPGAVKDLFARVVQARKDGQAALETVRAETAALRSLANAARMVEENPALLPLRALQAISASSGNTIVVDTSGHGAVRPAPSPSPDG